LVAGIVLVHLWDKSGNLFELGFNQGERVFDRGEYWRLLTSMFLHANPLHLLMNAFALHSLGSLVERLSGAWKMLLLYFVTGLFGSLASAAFHQEAVSVGASGAILGLAGALLALRWRRPKGFSRALAERIYGSLKIPVIIVFLTGFDLMAERTQVQVDNWAHFGGLASGFLLALAWPSLLQKSR
jgi:rhomboid protease GluP